MVSGPFLRPKCAYFWVKIDLSSKNCRPEWAKNHGTGVPKSLESKKNCPRHPQLDLDCLDRNWSKFRQNSQNQALPQSQNVPTFGYFSTLVAKTVAQNRLKIMEQVPRSP